MSGLRIMRLGIAATATFAVAYAGTGLTQPLGMNARFDPIPLAAP